MRKRNYCYLLVILYLFCNTTMSFSESQNTQYEQEKAALEKAKSIGTVEAYQEFLRKYSNSDWKEQAEYNLKYKTK